MESSLCQTCLSKHRRMIPLKKIKKILKEIHILKINDNNRGICWECHSLILKYFNFTLQVQRAQESINFKGQNPKCLSNLSTVTKVDYYDFKLTCNNDPLTDEEIKIDIKLEENVIDPCETDNSEKTSSNQMLCDVKLDSIVNEFRAEVFVDILKTENEPFEDDVNNYDENIGDVNNDDVNDNSDFNVDLDSKNAICKPEILNVASKRPKRKSKKEKFEGKYPKTKKRQTKKDSKINEDELKTKFAVIIFSEKEMQKHREEKRNQPNFKKIPFKCDSCVLGFFTKDKLDGHMKVRHNPSYKYTCDVCLTRYRNKRPLAGHMAMHFTRYRCVLCPYETRKLWSALVHSRGKHEADEKGKIHCPQCDMLTSTKEELTEHINTKHAVCCNECGEKFKGKNTLKTHIARLHSVKREFTCEVCKKAFLTKSRYETHVETHNTATAKRLAYCVTCDVQYKNINVYRNHLKTSVNHSERLYTCSVCEKKFVSKVYWRQHYNFFHLKKSKYSCDICKKIFMSDWRLKTHKQTQHGHSRTRDHACDICGKKFFTLSTLRGHQFIHSENRSFMCEDCGDTFKQRAALYTHNRLVHKGGKQKR